MNELVEKKNQVFTNLLNLIDCVDDLNLKTEIFATLTDYLLIGKEDC